MNFNSDNVESSKFEFNYHYICISLFSSIIMYLLMQVSLWKETLEGKWQCISDVKKGQGDVKESSDSAA